MRNKFFAILAFALVAVFALAFTTACKKPSNTSESESASDSGSRNEVSVILDEKSVAMYEYEEYTVGCSVTGSIESPLWKSSDESVVTVNDGVLSALSVGSATVTASVGEVKSTLEVKVAKTIYAPRLEVVKEVTIESGGAYTGEVTTLWKGEKIENDNYEWSLSDGEAENVVDIISDKGKFTVTAKNTGATAYYVSTAFRGTVVNAKISIKVVEPVITVVPFGSDAEPEDDGYGLTLWTNSVGGDTYADLSFAATIGDDTTENVNITWNYDFEDYDDTVAALGKTADGKYRVSKQSAGKTAIVGTYVAQNGKSATVKLYITVNKAVVNINYNSVIEVENLSPIAVPSEVDGAVTGFLLGGKDVLASVSGTQITLDKTQLPKEAKNLGKAVETVFVTDEINYVFKSEVYTLIIKTKTDLDSFGAIAKANGGFGVSGAALDGYFVLANDIEYNGRFESPTDTDDIYATNYELENGISWGDTTKNGFKGVFDGRGYNISGMTVSATKRYPTSSGGFIGYLHDNGVIRNVSFTDAVVEENNGFICAVGGGLIENVSIVYKSLGVGNATTNLDTAPRKMGSFFSYINRENATVRNCFVDITKAVEANAVHYLVGESGSSNLTVGTRAVKVENFIIVGGNETYAKEYGTKTYAFGYAELAASEECQKTINSFGDAWEIINGIPVLKKGI